MVVRAVFEVMPDDIETSPPKLFDTLKTQVQIEVRTLSGSAIF